MRYLDRSSGSGSSARRCVIVVALVVVVYFLFSIGTTEEEQCYVTHEYFPSEFEELWFSNIEKWKNLTCETMNQRTHMKMADAWISVSNPNQPMLTQQGNLRTDVFSRTEFTKKCGAAGGVVSVESRYIEPIAGLGRHPYTCLPGKLEDFIVNKRYLLIDCNLVNQKRAFYFDLGASTWSSGLGGASQSWFRQMYEDCGIQFTNYYMWEANPISPEKVFDEIPPEVLPYYHWFNIPAVPDPTAPSNPLNILKKMVTKDDFVLLKIDIDNTPVEIAFIEQLLDDKDLLALIDDFYFEYHVNVKEMYLHHGTQNVKETLVDSYELFRKFREAGVVAHSWV